MIREFIFISVMLIANNAVYGQEYSKRFYLSLSTASEPVDERLYGLSPVMMSEIRKMNTKPTPTKYLRFEFGYELLDWSRFTVGTSVHMAKEWNRYIRPFDHFLAGGPPGYNLRFLTKYQYVLVGVNLEPEYVVLRKGASDFIVGCSLIGAYKMTSYYLQPSRRDVLKQADFFSFEVNPLIGYSYKRYEATIFFRLLQSKKVDRVIHPKANFSGRSVLEKDIEHFNPTKIGLRLKWNFSFKRQKDGA